MARDSNFGPYHIRKWFLHCEETLATETGRIADGEPVRKVVVAAALHNPFAGVHQDDLSTLIAPSPQLGEEFAARIVAGMGGKAVQGYGKACIVGSRGEFEHGKALLTTAFVDPIRRSIGGGKSWVPSTGKRGVPGVTIDIPLAHKDALYVRSHYDTVTVSFGDAPADDELLIAFAVASRGRLHARLGGLSAEDAIGDGLY